jgi:heat shock protein HslJ
VKIYPNQEKKMKSTPKMLFPILLILFSIPLAACQAASMPESDTSQSQTQETPEEPNQVNPITIDQIINISWQWADLSESLPASQSVVPDPENYTLTFWEDGSLSFKADCNVGGGSYTVEGSQIEFGPMMSTMAMCPPESLYDQYLALLGQVESFAEENGKLVLVLKDGAGVMRFNNGGPAEKPETPAEMPAPEEKTLYVGPEKVDCVGVAPMKCYQVKEDPDGEWQLFYNEIEGFEWEPGYTYELRVAVHQVENPPADGSSLRYELIEVVDKTEMTVEKPKQYISIDKPVEGTKLDASQAILVSGMGAGLFEGNVVVQILDEENNELALQPTIIQSPEAGTGGEGPWEVELFISINTEIPGKIVAFATSPKDGSIVTRDEVRVTFLPQTTTNTSLENTSWLLTGLTDGTLNSALAVHQVTATFMPEEVRLSGGAGCNRYFASYELEGAELRIPGPIGSTMMMCPEPQMTIESTYLKALEQVANYELSCNNTLNLFDAEGNAILIFQVDPYSTTTAFTREELANTAYLSEWTDSGLVQLVNGEFRAPIAEGSASELVVVLTNYAAFGDLDGDGQEEAAVILVTNAGGSGSFYDLAIVGKQGETLTNLANTLLGDRVQIKSLRIEDGEISVDFLTQGPDDPMCCPTQYVVNHYALQNGELVQTGTETIE